MNARCVGRRVKVVVVQAVVVVEAHQVVAEVRQRQVEVGGPEPRPGEVPVVRAVGGRVEDAHKITRTVVPLFREVRSKCRHGAHRDTESTEKRRRRRSKCFAIGAFRSLCSDFLIFLSLTSFFLSFSLCSLCSLCLVALRALHSQTDPFHFAILWTPFTNCDTLKLMRRPRRKRVMAGGTTAPGANAPGQVPGRS